MNLHSLKAAVLVPVVAVVISITGCNGDEGSTGPAGDVAAKSSTGQMCEVASASLYYNDRLAGVYGPVTSNKTLRVLLETLVKTDKELVSVVPDRWVRVARKLERHQAYVLKVFADADYDTSKMSMNGYKAYERRAQEVSRQSRPMVEWLRRTCEPEMKAYGSRPDDAPGAV